MTVAAQGEIPEGGKGLPFGRGVVESGHGEESSAVAVGDHEHGLDFAEELEGDL
jgi:hypothetical protein